MAKTFLDELILELLKLQAQDVDNARTAIENGQQLPPPASPKDIFHTVNRVAEAHQITSDEMATLISMRGGEITPEDIKLLHDMNQQSDS